MSSHQQVVHFIFPSDSGRSAGVARSFGVGEVGGSNPPGPNLTDILRVPRHYSFGAPAKAVVAGNPPGPIQRILIVPGSIPLS